MINTKLSISNYDGTVDTVLTPDRPHNMGVNEQLMITDNTYKRIDEYDYKQQRVQAILFDKYELYFVVEESYSIELLKYAKGITVNVNNNAIFHDAVILEVSREEVSGSNMVKFTLEYYDRKLTNYKYNLPPLVNYLRSDALTEIAFSQRNVLRIDYNGQVYDFNTMLDFVPMAAAPETDQFNNTQTGQKITTNSVIKRQVNLVFYLNAEDIIPFQSYLPLADGYSVKAYYFYENVAYVIKEVPDVTVEMAAGWDIYKCSCTFTYNIINHYSYANGI